MEPEEVAAAADQGDGRRAMARLAERRLPEQITVRLPSDLVLLVRCACRHSSAPAIAKLRDWRDEHPEALPWEAFRSAEQNAAQAEYEEPAAEVTTAGEIWRAGFRLRMAHAAAIPEKSLAG